jgi:hypothetical protein
MLIQKPGLFLFLSFFFFFNYLFLSYIFVFRIIIESEGYVDDDEDSVESYTSEGEIEVTGLFLSSYFFLYNY